jgi:hypothetical protein
MAQTYAELLRRADNNSRSETEKVRESSKLIRIKLVFFLD